MTEIAISPNMPLPPIQSAHETKRRVDMALLQMPERMQVLDPLLTADEVAVRLNVTRDWVWTTRPGDCPTCQ